MSTTSKSEDADDVLMDISSPSSRLLIYMAGISTAAGYSRPVKQESRPDSEYYVKKRTALARGIVTSHRHMTQDLRKARDDMERTDREVDWFLYKERRRSTRPKYPVYIRPEEFVSQYEKYSIADYADIKVHDYSKPPITKK